MDYILILTRPNCIFCQKLKDALDELDIPFQETHSNNVVVPSIKHPYTGKTIISGLPHKSQLIELKKTYELSGTNTNN